MSDELVQNWLKSNTPKRFEEADLIYQPYQGTQMKTNIHTPIEFDTKSKKRIYKFLNKTPLAESLDESTRNYGT